VKMAPEAARRGATALTSAQWHGPQGGAGAEVLLLAVLRVCWVTTETGAARGAAGSSSDSSDGICE
jgi:hypothetical protein